MSTMSTQYETRGWIAKNGVVESAEELRGWHLVDACLHKPGVYSIEVTRKEGSRAEMRRGFAKQSIITIAREMGYLSASNGFTLP